MTDEPTSGVEAEREACAKVAESLPGQRGNSPEHLVGMRIAAAIRARAALATPAARPAREPVAWLFEYGSPLGEPEDADVEWRSAVTLHRPPDGPLMRSLMPLYATPAASPATEPVAWLQRFRAGEPLTLHYHGKKLPVSSVSPFRKGLISVDAKGTGLPVTLREDGTYSGDAPIWLEPTPPASPSPAPAAVEDLKIATDLIRIADACRRTDGSDIPLGQQCREAATALSTLAADKARIEAERDEAQRLVNQLSDDITFLRKRRGDLVREKDAAEARASASAAVAVDMELNKIAETVRAYASTGLENLRITRAEMAAISQALDAIVFAAAAIRKETT